MNLIFMIFFLLKFLFWDWLEQIKHQGPNNYGEVQNNYTVFEKKISVS